MAWELESVDQSTWLSRSAILMEHYVRMLEYFGRRRGSFDSGCRFGFWFKKTRHLISHPIERCKQTQKTEKKNIIKNKHLSHLRVRGKKKLPTKDFPTFRVINVKTRWRNRTSPGQDSSWVNQLASHFSQFTMKILELLQLSLPMLLAPRFLSVEVFPLCHWIFVGLVFKTYEWNLFAPFKFHKHGLLES